MQVIIYLGVALTLVVGINGYLFTNPLKGSSEIGDQKSMLISRSVEPFMSDCADVSKNAAVTSEGSKGILTTPKTYTKAIMSTKSQRHFSDIPIITSAETSFEKATKTIKTIKTVKSSSVFTNPADTGAPVVLTTAASEPLESAGSTDYPSTSTTPLNPDDGAVATETSSATCWKVRFRTRATVRT